MKVSLIQMNSQDDKAANLEQARSLIEAACAADGPDMVVLPEMFTYLTTRSENYPENAETFPNGEAYAMLRELATGHGVFIHGGSMLETDGNRIFNTTVVFNREGRELARYRKIHLFDVTTPDGKEYRESKAFGRGEEVVTYEAEGITVGCTICYDLRFGELYRALAEKGAEAIMVPAAFTLQTGKDHWEVLLRARAIETQTYIIAPGQRGSFNAGARWSFGHSLVADPWGHIIAMAQDQVGYVTARLDFDYQASIRQRFPVAQHRILP